MSWAHLCFHAVVPLPGAGYPAGLPHIVVEADHFSPGLGRLQLLRNEAEVLAAARQAAGKAIDVRIQPLTAPAGQAQIMRLLAAQDPAANAPAGSSIALMSIPRLQQTAP